MKYIDEYRDGAVAQVLAARIERTVERPMRLMEICGTHTMAIFRHGLRSLLPEAIELVSGPGCPVCVTATEDIDRCIRLARTPGVIVATFGDLVRVPGSRSSLRLEQASGADVRMVYSTMDALETAKENGRSEVVFLGIGFETTAPTVAAAMIEADRQGIGNFSVLALHKLLPPAMEALLADPDNHVDGFICPGHVTTIIGTSAYRDVVEHHHRPCVVTGFEPVDILEGILLLAEQIAAGRAEVEIQYRRGASADGNPGALRFMWEVFEPADALWRGLGSIPGSGLKVREAYAARDARLRFDLVVPPAAEPAGCRCAEVLRGRIRPPECPLFGRRCTPQDPVGPCMVSGEGTCAAYYRYRG